MERCWRNGGRVSFGYGNGRATGEMRAKAAVEAALAGLTSIEENGLALNVMVLIAGAGQSLMLQEYEDVVQVIHAVIPDTANLTIDCICNELLGEELEVTLVVEYLQHIPTGGGHGIPAYQPSP